MPTWHKQSRTVGASQSSSADRAYAVQLAAKAGLHVIAVAKSDDIDYAQSLGAETVVDYQARKLEDVVSSVDLWSIRLAETPAIGPLEC